MAEIKNLKVKAGEENIIKAAEVYGISIFGDCQPFSEDKKLGIEASNGRWVFKLEDISYLEFDIVTEKRFIHVASRAGEILKDAEIQ